MLFRSQARLVAQLSDAVAAVPDLPAVPQADGKIHAGDAIKATFHVSATATMNGSYLLSASNDKNWPMQILGQNPFPLQAALAGQESTNDLVVQVTVPAGTADGVTATLSISAKELTPGSSVPFLNPSVAMTTGAKPQDPDSGVTLVTRDMLRAVS